MFSEHLKICVKKLKEVTVWIDEIIICIHLKES